MMFKTRFIVLKGETEVHTINNTLVDLKADINYQARVSKETGILPMKRTNLEPYHYLDHQSNNDDNDIKLHNECHMSEIQLQKLLDNT